MSWTVYRRDLRQPTRHFTQVPNALLRDTSLSPIARLAMAWMASMPADWVLTREEAMATLGIGRDKWQAVQRELREAGALDRSTAHDDKGQFLGLRHTISWEKWRDRPNDATVSLKSRSTVNREPENPVQDGHQGPENPAPYKNTMNTLKGPENPAYGENLPSWLSPAEAQRLRNVAHIVNNASEVRGFHCTPSQAEKLIALGWVPREKFTGWGIEA